MASLNNAGFNSISHEGRAFLALVTFHRYQGLGPKKKPPDTARLAREESRKLARVLASLFRVIYLFSGAVEGVLPRLQFIRNDSEGLMLVVPGELADMLGEKPLSRIEALGRELGESIDVQTGK